MKTILLALSLALLAGPALADRPGPDWMPMERVIDALKRAGYTTIGALEADDGRWEGEGSKDGAWMAFHADARTGAILREWPD